MKFSSIFLCLFFIFFSLSLSPSLYGKGDFISSPDDLNEYIHDCKIVIIASMGRSASTMLTETIRHYAKEYTVLKTHLAPDSRHCGKTMFVFSNPDQAAESALYRMMYRSPSNGFTHVKHLFSADRKWFAKIGNNAKNQTDKDNLLAYDGLGYEKHLTYWLFKKVKKCSPDKATILAVKYENLWDEETVEAINKFLRIPEFRLPPRIERGCSSYEIPSKMRRFIALYNQGTAEQPIYRAYDKARRLWQEAKPFEFFIHK